MTDTPNSQQAKRSSINQLAHDYDWLIKLIVMIVLGWLGYQTHDNGTSIEFTKDIAAKSAETQQNQVKVQVGDDSKKAFEALKVASSQPVIQPEK